MTWFIASSVSVFLSWPNYLLLGYYYRKAKEEGWSALSAFKLLQIDEEFNIFQGSWSQVLSRRLYLPAKQSPASKDGDLPLIVTIDFEGVIQVQGDITNARRTRTAEVEIP
ncbi:hypothetical protein V6N12_017290 [Hibiscus sabdariffa]|uniref:Uncharacterized protein n=1 Tax=Hibiscus sabdariffa TaxID=183260 RepID=A0ABR2CF32_9ROSI